MSISSTGVSTNALAPTCLRPSLRVIFSTFEPLKKPSPTEITPFGRENSVKAVPENALAPISVSLDGRPTPALFPPRPMSVKSDSSPFDLKALWPMRVTLSDSVTFASFAQWRKASSGISVSPAGREISRIEQL